jgi:hypothetical protein
MFSKFTPNSSDKARGQPDCPKQQCTTLAALIAFVMPERSFFHLLDHEVLTCNQVAIPIFNDWLLSLISNLAFD